MIDLTHFSPSVETRIIAEKPLNFIIGGDEQSSLLLKDICNPYDGQRIARLCHATREDIQKAIEKSVVGFQITKKFSSQQKSEILIKISELIEENKEALALTISLEAGKPLKTARSEVERSAYTFRVAAEESKRIEGKIIRLDWLPHNENRTGQIIRVPRGPVLGITPFNFPINLVAHKIAPAIAAGNSIIIRPATQTSVTSLLLGKIIIAAGFPPDAISIVPCSTDTAAALVEDDRIKVLSFTGSPDIGWMLKQKARKKMVTLELGGNAGNIIHFDADQEWAASRIVWGGFTYAGQACISVQRVYVHEDIYQSFIKNIIKKTELIRTGDPLDENTDMGPVIDLSSADKIRNWIKEAQDKGAKILTGGLGSGTIIPPTIVESSDETLNISCKEVFGPVIVVRPYKHISEAIAGVNDSLYGLQAGLFTDCLSVVNEASENLEVGGLNVNDVSTYRIDHMPYGGVKNSGFGREGLTWAIEEMTEIKLITYNNLSFK